MRTLFRLLLKSYRYTFHDGTFGTVKAERYENSDLECVFYIGGDVVRRVPLWMLEKVEEV